MIGIIGVLEILLMTAKAIRGRQDIVISIMAFGALIGDLGMGTVERVELVMDVKSGGLPARFKGMTGRTIC